MQPPCIHTYSCVWENKDYASFLIDAFRHLNISLLKVSLTERALFIQFLYYVFTLAHQKYYAIIRLTFPAAYRFTLSVITLIQFSCFICVTLHRDSRICSGESSSEPEPHAIGNNSLISKYDITSLVVTRIGEENCEEELLFGCILIGCLS